MTLLYDFCLLILGLVALPKWLFQFGKYKKSVKQHLGFQLPKAKAPSIWIHAVSVGEVRVMIPLYLRLKKAYPQTEIFISTITQTGLDEAKRSLPGATDYFTLPFDFSWNMKRLVKRLQPTLLILSEGDLWLNMLTAVKKFGGRTAVVSAKLSLRSAKRYALVPFFSSRLFGALDLICAQNALYAKRLEAFSNRVHVTGNLKFDIHPTPLSSEEIDQWEKRLGLKPGQKLLVIGSTHPGEEEMLLSAAMQIPDIKILLVPRHPQRFDRVFAALPPSSGRLSSGLTGEESIILIDAMGLLNSLYQLATLAIVGGSFVPGIGGHNILEPIQAHIPVLFGPYMDKQPELVELVLSAEAGKQLPASLLPETVNNLLTDSQEYTTMQTNAVRLDKSCRGATDRTWKVLFS